jgi:pre-mRNA-splicing factor ATP-dependent RNA helicase DHX16
MKKSSKRQHSSDSDSAEESRRVDLKERDEFANRLKKRDEDRVKKISESTSKRTYEEAAKRLKLEAEDRDKLLPKLRVQSRRKYLEKRKEDKVIELEADIADDEYLFEESR